jgi:hypothetical protein
MGDINLANPLEIIPAATKVMNYAWSIAPDRIIVSLNYYAADNITIVKQETFYILGDDFTSLKDAVISEGAVGKKYLDVIEKAIRNKIKILKGFVGTVN